MSCYENLSSNGIFLLKVFAFSLSFLPFLLLFDTILIECINDVFDESVTNNIFLIELHHANAFDAL